MNCHTSSSFMLILSQQLRVWREIPQQAASSGTEGVDAADQTATEKMVVANEIVLPRDWKKLVTAEASRDHQRKRFHAQVGKIITATTPIAWQLLRENLQLQRRGELKPTPTKWLLRPFDPWGQRESGKASQPGFAQKSSGASNPKARFPGTGGTETQDLLLDCRGSTPNQRGAGFASPDHFLPGCKKSHSETRARLQPWCFLRTSQQGRLTHVPP